MNTVPDLKIWSFTDLSTYSGFVTKDTAYGDVSELLLKFLKIFGKIIVTRETCNEILFS